ncbi:hypothetical protein CYMTET_42559, partial [Cymbomonas tetramitiformis]
EGRAEHLPQAPQLALPNAEVLQRLEQQHEQQLVEERRRLEQQHQEQLVEERRRLEQQHQEQLVEERRRLEHELRRRMEQEQHAPIAEVQQPQGAQAAAHQQEAVEAQAQEEADMQERRMNRDAYLNTLLEEHRAWTPLQRKQWARRPTGVDGRSPRRFPLRRHVSNTRMTMTSLTIAAGVSSAMWEAMHCMLELIWRPPVCHMSA